MYSIKHPRKDPVMHKATQKRFFELVTSQTPLYAELGNPINTYKELIHYRFKEVILSAYPRFLELLDENTINELIVDFIKSKPQTPFIWKMPDEFRHFLANQELAKEFPFMDDLLWFEWIEIELFMGHYKIQEDAIFSWDKAYALSDSALIKELNFPVHYNEDYEWGGIHPLLMFYNFQTHDVHFQEITPFLQQLLVNFNNENVEQTLKELCKAYDIDPTEVKELLQETLQNFVQSRIIKELS